MRKKTKSDIIRQFCIDNGLPYVELPAPAQDEMLAYIELWKGLPSVAGISPMLPTSYWHHDEDFAAFMDAALKEVPLGD